MLIKAFVSLEKEKQKTAMLPLVIHDAYVITVSCKVVLEPRPQSMRRDLVSHIVKWSWVVFLTEWAALIFSLSLFYYFKSPI